MDFSQISLLLVVAAAAGIVAKIFKQPLLIGYLFAGFMLGAIGLVTDTEVFSGLGQVGVTLLLFLVGLEMNIRELPTIGKVAFITGISQIVVTFSIGFIAATLLGYSSIPAAYSGIALAFSSTIIIVKLLSEKNDLDSLYGKISIGFLLVQDLVAILLLMFLAGLGRGGLDLIDYAWLAVKALVLLVSVWVLSKKVLPSIFNKFLAKNQELLFISSIAWALGVATVVAGPMGFTLEIGGFLAGLALSNLPEHLQIASRTRPLRDFFLTIFFLILGTHLVINNIGQIIIPTIIFSAIVLIGNPLIVMTVLGLLGYKRRTSLFSGLTVAQISEFSLILMAMGAGLGHINESQTATIILVAVITMTASTYLVLGSDNVYKKVKNMIKVFERSKPKEKVLLEEHQLENHVVLIGAGRTGKTLLSYFVRNNIPLLVVDFNPKIFFWLTAEKIPVLFGDMTDPEILQLSRLEKAKMIISTSSNLADNLSLLEYIKSEKINAHVIVKASLKDEAIKYYEKGATYVIVPQEVAGEHIRHLLRVYGIGSDRIRRMGANQFNRLLSSH